MTVDATAILRANLSWLVNNLLVQHAALHTGEIAVLRGLQGLPGHP